MERGDANRRLDTLAKLARALGVPVASLLDRDSLDRSGEPPATVEYRHSAGAVRKVAEPR